MASVVLVSPRGEEYTVSDIGVFVNAIYSWGYRPKVGTIEQARATVAQGTPPPPYVPGLDAVTVGELQDPESAASVTLRGAFAHLDDGVLVIGGEPVGGSGDGSTAFYEAADAADVQAKVDAAVVTGGVVLLPYGTVALPAPISIPSNLTKRVVIRGRGVDATVVPLTATVKQLVSMVRSNGPGSILRNVTVEDVTVDASALAAGTATGNVSGAIIGPVDRAEASEVSWSDITVRRVKGIGAPVNPTITHQFFWVYVMSVVATASTLRTIQRITVEDFDFTGGDNGVYIGGQRAGTGATDFANLLLDDIYCRRGRHVMPTPTGFLASNNFIFGHRGRGVKLRVADLYGYGCGDAALEVNAWDDAIVERCTIEDAWNSAFFHVHYNTAPSPSAQRLVYRDCVAKRTNYVPTAFVAGVGQGYGFYASPSPWANPAPTRMDRCAFVKTTPDFTVEGAAIIYYAPRGLVIDDFVSDESGIAYDANGTASAAIQIRSAGSGYTVPVRMRRVRVRVAGAKGAGADRLWTAIRFPFGGYALDLEDIAIDYAITGGVGPSSCRAIYLGDDSATTILKGSVRRARFEGAVADTSAWLIAVGPTNLTTIQPKILIEDCDIRLPADLNITTVGRELVRFRGTAGSTQHTTGLVIIKNSTPGNARYPANKITVTPGASPYTYQNLDAMNQRVLVNGGTVSSLAWSVDGSEFFDLAQTNGAVRLQPGEYLRVTYSATPTIVKVFEK